MTTFWLAILAAASEVLYLSLLRLDAINGVRPVAIFLATIGACFALYGAAFLVVRNAPNGRGVWILAVGGAILFRITLLPAGLPPDLSWSERFEALRADWRGASVSYERFELFDDDIWRYLWDGRVGATGGNPYIKAPADAGEESGADAHPDWDTIRENINYPSVRTIYPPLAQFVFRIAYWLAPGSVLAMKIVVVGFDLLAYGFLILTLKTLKQAPVKSILYGWNPLVVKVFAGSGHIDAVLVAALAATCYFLARKKPTAASVSLGLAAAAKFAPIVLLPFLARRVGLRRAGLVCLTTFACFIPYLGAKANLFSGLAAFSQGWQFNSGLFRLFVMVTSTFSSRPDTVARILCAVLIAGGLAMLFRTDDADPDTFARVAVAALGIVLLCSPMVAPWYVTWLLPFAVVARDRVAIFFSAAVCLAFLVMVRRVEWPLALLLEYGTLAAFAGWEISNKRFGLRFTRG